MKKIELNITLKSMLIFLASIFIMISSASCGDPKSKDNPPIVEDTPIIDPQLQNITTEELPESKQQTLRPCQGH